MVPAVAGKERDAPPAERAEGDHVARRPVRRLHPPLLRPLEERIEPAATDDSDFSLGHVPRRGESEWRLAGLPVWVVRRYEECSLSRPAATAAASAGSTIAARPRRITSAKLSIRVGSSLAMMSAAPWVRATSGSHAAGVTWSEDPTTRRRSADRTSR